MVLQNTNSSQTVRSLILSLRGNVVALPISFILVRRFAMEIWICLRGYSVTTFLECNI